MDGLCVTRHSEKKCSIAIERMVFHHAWCFLGFPKNAPKSTNEKAKKSAFIISLIITASLASALSCSTYPSYMLQINSMQMSFDGKSQPCRWRNFSRSKALLPNMQTDCFQKRITWSQPGFHFQRRVVVVSHFNDHTSLVNSPHTSLSWTEQNV